MIQKIIIKFGFSKILETLAFERIKDERYISRCCDKWEGLDRVFSTRSYYCEKYKRFIIENGKNILK